MKHKVKIPVVEENRTIFGKKKVTRYVTAYVDGKTYRKLQRNKPYSIEEMMFYDWIFGD